MSGGSKISPWLANLAQQAFLPQAGRQEMLKVMLFLTMQKSLFPTGGLQENKYWKENWGNLLDPQARCLMTTWRATSHENWPWKEGMRGRDSTGGPRRQWHWERQHYSAQEQGGTAWPKGPFGQHKGQKSQTNNEQGILMVYLHFCLPL